MSIKAGTRGRCVLCGGQVPPDNSYWVLKDRAQHYGSITSYDAHVMPIGQCKGSLTAQQNIKDGRWTDAWNEMQSELEKQENVKA